jgi:hypothetical protein
MKCASRNVTGRYPLWVQKCMHARVDLLRETKDRSSISVYLVSDRLSHTCPTPDPHRKLDLAS